jgi:aldehyde dehydrogenase (NAD+)
MMTTIEWRESVLPEPSLVIGDRCVTESSGGTYQHIDPATGRAHPLVPLAGAGDIDRAVRAARAASAVWRGLTADQRRVLLFRLANRITEEADPLTAVAIHDNGMPMSIARWSAHLAADLIMYNAGWADKVGGEVIPTWPGPALDYTVDEPYGVVGVILPWNGPLFGIGMVLGPALAAGNCVVLKPSELAPFAAIRFGQLCLEAGLPPGVVNVVPGAAEGGQALVTHPGVDKIHFTGSVPTATRILAAAAPGLKPVALELGGKSAALIFDDADLETATMQAALNSAILASGQSCLANTRVLAQRGVYDEVVNRIAAIASGVTIGDPFDEQTVMGPVITEGACRRIQGIIEQAVEQKAGKLVAGGQRLGGPLADGYFLQATVFADVDNGSELAQEEIFGPVVSILPFADEEEAVQLANDTRYGLAGYIYTNDLRRAHRVARGIDAGFIAINRFEGLPPGAPFGGNKASGFGRLGGRPGINEFLRPKNVFVSLAEDDAPPPGVS